MKTLQKLYISSLKENMIPQNAYNIHQVKQGLRNENGTGVKVGLTKICDVIGYTIKQNKKINIPGQLYYRGYSIDSLICKKPEYGFGFEAIVFLLIFGFYPDTEQLQLFHSTIMELGHIKEHDISYNTTNLLNALQIEILKMYGQDKQAENDHLENRLYEGLSIFSCAPLFLFSHYKKETIHSYPFPEKSLTENILYILKNGKSYTKHEIEMLDILLILQAEHGGGNNSTFANVVISSTGTDIYSCISAAIGSLKGPKHGGANQKVTEQFQEILKICHHCDLKKLKHIAKQILNHDFFDKSGLIYGIGHAIYSLSDPRAQIIKHHISVLSKEKQKEEEFKLLAAFEKSAIETILDIKGNQSCANIDFYSGFAYTLLDIPLDLFTPLFCISRISGWLAHHLENRQNNRKLIRPANVYIGPYYKEEIS